MRGIFLSALLLAGLVLVLAGPVAASPITWSYLGTIIGTNDPNNQLDGSVVAGSPFSGTYTFESTMTDDLPSDTTTGLYTQPRPSTSIVVLDVGNYHIVAKSDYIRVENSVKDILVLHASPFITDPIGLQDISMGGRDLSGHIVDSDALPIIPPDLSLFYSSGIVISGIPSNDPLQTALDVQGSLETLTLIPEPASLLLIASGLVCVSRAGKRGGSHLI